ncbi:hypothetical protein JAAARDRAFT_51563 [Jaapia argillacea MUCL 33604]|uniref:Uncharacterized protein n=1 Tax=Jaapia argillacea MUCL 33604 TaxID=933084 RepID=A0A067PHF3_9AGAM|nr:hypothetical protein JAAARDRAFT_51563 [Jaapia argillacea MUCL 33604]
MSLPSVNTMLLGDITSTSIDPDQSSKSAGGGPDAMEETLKNRDMEIAMHKVRISRLEDTVRGLQEDMGKLQETIKELKYEPQAVMRNLFQRTRHCAFASLLSYQALQVANKLREAVSCNMCRKVMWEPYMMSTPLVQKIETQVRNIQSNVLAEAHLRPRTCIFKCRHNPTLLKVAYVPLLDPNPFLAAQTLLMLSDSPMQCTTHHDSTTTGLTVVGTFDDDSRASTEPISPSAFRPPRILPAPRTVDIARLSYVTGAGRADDPFEISEDYFMNAEGVTVPAIDPAVIAMEKMLQKEISVWKSQALRLEGDIHNINVDFKKKQKEVDELKDSVKKMVALKKKSRELILDLFSRVQDLEEIVDEAQKELSQANDDLVIEKVRTGVLQKELENEKAGGQVGWDEVARLVKLVEKLRK